MTENYKKLFPTEFDSNPKNKNRFKDYYSGVLDEMSIKVRPKKKLRYLSLFTGIGGFEVAIQTVFPSAECIAYSEVKKHAIEVYSKHFPGHLNLGDVSKITKEQIQTLVREKGCDLIVGGFPCTNLSSMANIKGNNLGLNGPKSGLFWTMCDIIRWVKEIDNDVDILIENNSSMKKEFVEEISSNLSDILKKCIYLNNINSGKYVVQQRKRLYWSSFKIQSISDKKIQSWNDVLSDTKDISRIRIDCQTLSLNLPIKRNTYKDRVFNCLVIVEHGDYFHFEKVDINHGKTRLMDSNHTDTLSTDDENPYLSYPIGNSRCITGSPFIDKWIIDRRFGGKNEFIPRYITPYEYNQLFTYPDNWIHYDEFCYSKIKELYGNSVVVIMIISLMNGLN